MTIHLVVTQNIDGDYDLCYAEDGTRLSTHSSYNEASYVRGRLHNLADSDDSNQVWWESVVFYHENILRELNND